MGGSTNYHNNNNILTYITSRKVPDINDNGQNYQTGCRKNGMINSRIISLLPPPPMIIFWSSGTCIHT